MTKAKEEVEYNLTKKEICAIFGVTERTVARWNSLGMPHKREGIYPRYNLEKTREWVQGRSANFANPWAERLESLGAVSES